MNDPLPPQCEELFQAQEAARKEHLEAWGKHAAYMSEIGAKPGRIVTMSAEQGDELKRRTDRFGAAMHDWQTKFEAWVRLCGGMRFRQD